MRLIKLLFLNNYLFGLFNYHRDNMLDMNMTGFDNFIDLIYYVRENSCKPINLLISSPIGFF